MRMKVAQVLHMKGGTTEASYSNNSLYQQKVISSTKPIRDEVITCLYKETIPRSLAVADLGCSSGPNTFSVIYELIETVEKLCRDLNHESPEYITFLNDLPSNDFNTVFKSLESFKQKLSKEMVGGKQTGPCYIAGVPGSFYGRIFPTKSLHFVHSSYSLHWMSQVPEGVENNKGNVCMTRTSPLNVCNSYYHQFQRDFSMFLKYRAQEVVEGGHMVLTLLGRSSGDPSMEKSCHIWDIVAEALNQMVLERIIKEDQMDSFNVPFYTPSASELESEVKKEGSFAINHLEAFETSWEAACDKKRNDSKEYQITQFIRAVAEPLVMNHFGESIMDDVFEHCQDILADRMSKGDLVHVSLCISLTRTS
ncbi:salicylate carboxymethyltransferase-like [Neltuma alba]|uniref:salicylate carboxymethyltransferase-like n=1 Tax=Neltuma alba TaxID=207710 RepID=UPI0010A55991|nr:salicylate carboxymethyltransferase-like [Prosopis alba]